jgi:hypothetical protein
MWDSVAWRVSTSALYSISWLPRHRKVLDAIAR